MIPKGRQKSPTMGWQGRRPFFVTRTWRYLVRLLPSRAQLRFTKPSKCNQFIPDQTAYPKPNVMD
jgi:hypothetical protein